MSDRNSVSNQITPLKNNSFNFSQGGHDFLITTNFEQTNKKVITSSEELFKYLKITCLDCSNNHPTAPTNHQYKPIIEVNPHIVVNNGSVSYKKQALIYLAGAITVLVAQKYGLSIVSSLSSFVVSQLNLNLVQKAQNIVSYISALNPISFATNTPSFATKTASTTPGLNSILKNIIYNQNNPESFSFSLPSSLLSA